MVAKEFDPSITKSYYITRHLLLKEIKGKSYLMKGKMLDFGCGSKPYRSLFNVNTYLGVDFKGDGHGHDKEQIDVFYNGRTIPFEPNTFDCILSTEVFEHIFNLEEILKELYCILKPNGRMLITCPFIIAEHEAPVDCSRYTSFGIKDLLQRNGFKILHYKKMGSSIQAQMQLFISYLDSYVLCKLNKIPIIHRFISSVVFAFLNLLCMCLNFLLPVKKDAFLSHVIVVRKMKEPSTLN